MKNIKAIPNKRKALVLMLLFSSTLLFSCKKWLDVKPGGQIKQEELFKNEIGFDRAISGVYIQMQEGLYKDNLSSGMTSALSQCYERFSNSYLYDAANYNYTSSNLLPTINSIWTNMYTAIGNLNNILDNVDKYKRVFTGSHYELIKGQALGLRAFLHFDLLRLYGKSPVDNLNSTSIPYVTDFGKNVTPSGTISQILNACIKDLDQAEELLSVSKNFYPSSSNNANADLFNEYTQNRINYWAVKALKARIYLYAGNKAMALQNANDVINNSSLTLITNDKVGNNSTSDNLFSNEFLFAIKSSLLQSYLRTRLLYNPAVNGIGDSWKSQFLYNTDFNINNIYEIDKGGSTDFRYLYNFITTNGSSICVKFPSSATAIGGNQIPLIRLSEMYYIAAEASATLNESTKYLNTIRSHRGLSNLVIADNATLQEEIAKEYQKEFYAEGQLFYYYKRLGLLAIPRAKSDMTMYDFTLPIPQDEIDLGNR